MKHLLLFAAAFALGVYVGKPAQVTLQVPDAPTCDRVETASSAPEPRKASAQPQAEPSGKTLLEIFNEGKAASEAKSADTSEPTPAETPQAESIAPVEQDELPIPDPKAWAKREVGQMASMIIRYSSYQAKYTFTTIEYAHIEELRAEIRRQNLRVLSEGPSNVGKYVYMMTIVGPDYKEGSGE